MLKLLYLSALLLISCDLNSPPPDPTFRSFGLPNDEVGNSITATKDHSFVAVGYTNSVRNNFDAYMLKISPHGFQVWSKTFGGDNLEQFFDVCETQNGDLLAAGTIITDLTQTDMYVVRTDANGKLIWSRNLGGLKRDVAYAVVECPNRDILVFGTTNSYGAGESDFYLLRLDPGGNIIWTKTYGSVLPEEGRDVSLAANGDILMTGYRQQIFIDRNPRGVLDWDVFTIRAASNGDIVWKQYYNVSDRPQGTLDIGNSILEDKNGRILVHGSTQGTDKHSDLLILSSDPDGALSFSKIFNFTPFDDGHDIIELAAGFALVGTTGLESNREILLCQIDFSGNLLWRKEFGHRGNDAGNKIILKDNEIVIAGTTKDFDTGKSNIALVRVDLDETNSNGASVSEPKYGGVNWYPGLLGKP